MKTPKWIVIIILVLAFSMPAMPVSAQSPAASISLSPPAPNPGAVGADISFTLVLDVANIVPGVAGIDIYLTYDPAFVVPNSTPIPVVEPLPDFFGPSNVTNVDSFPPAGCPAAGAGPLPCIHLVAAGPAQVTRSGAVARFHFLGFGATPPGATACFGVLLAPIAMVDANGFPVAAPLTPPVPQCVPIVPNMMTGIVLRQGTPAAAPNLGGGTLACSDVKLINGGVVTFPPVSTVVGGGFALLAPPLGVQTLRAEYPGYLASQKTITIGAGGPLDVGPTTLRGGDVNSDNKINILDVGIIIGNFGATAVPVESSGPCPPPFPPPPPPPPPLSVTLDRADINDDGIINISDLAIIAGSNFGMVGPTPWQ